MCDILRVLIAPSTRKIRKRKLIVATITCTSWRHHARARAAGFWRRHWADSSPSKSAMPFLDKCSDPSTVYRCLFFWACYPALRFPFFPTSLRVSLLQPALSHLPFTFSPLHDDESSLCRRTCSPAGRPPEKRHTRRPEPRTQAVHLAPSADWPVPASSCWRSSLSATLRFQHAWHHLSPWLPSFDP